jgi:hypothetical protein
MHVSAADKLLDVSSKPKRAAILGGVLNLHGLDMKSAREARNHLEHFDERLDKRISARHIAKQTQVTTRQVSRID